MSKNRERNAAILADLEENYLDRYEVVARRQGVTKNVVVGVVDRATRRDGWVRPRPMARRTRSA